MRKTILQKWLAACLLLLGALSAQTHGEESTMQTVEYHGIRSTDPGGNTGLRNPERGWRIETLIAEPNGAGVWGSAYHLRGKLPPVYSDTWWVLDAERYAGSGLTLAQTYCYLDSFMDRPISDEKLADLQRSLDTLRKRGWKALLRFAYEKDMQRQGGPTLQTILGHLDQLEPIIRENVDVIFVLQAGLVGAWGEWHSSTHGLEQNHDALAALTEKLLNILPPGRMTQVRVPKYKRWVLESPTFGGYVELDAGNAHTDSPAARIGYHNDGFLAGATDGGTWPEPPHYGAPGNPEFDIMTAESPYLAIDGELFWADQAGKVDGLAAAVRMQQHHYTSFSLAHSFSEREGKPFSIDDWLHTSFSKEQAQEAGLRISDGFFQNALDQPVERTFFEYIRDHLGYRLELQQARFPRQMQMGGRLRVEIDLINRGFSALHNPRSAYLVLVGADASVATFPVSDADPRTWQPGVPGQPLVHTVHAQEPVPEGLSADWYLLGLWLPDAADQLRLDSRYAARVANRDVPWWTDDDGSYGINVLGSIEIVGR